MNTHSYCGENLINYSNVYIIQSGKTINQYSLTLYHLSRLQNTKYCHTDLSLGLSR